MRLEHLFRLSLSAGLAGASFALANAQSSSGVVFPSLQDDRAIQETCGAGISNIVSIKGDVDAALKSWKSASAGVGVSVAKERLTGFLSVIKNDVNLAPNYKIYADCVERQTQRWLDQANRRPIPVSRTGSSNALLRSDYVSDDEMRDVGCSQAEDSARRKLGSDCGSFVLVVLGSSRCQKTGQSPAVFLSQLDGECRII